MVNSWDTNPGSLWCWTVTLHPPPNLQPSQGQAGAIGNRNLSWHSRHVTSSISFNWAICPQGQGVPVFVHMEFEILILDLQGVGKNPQKWAQEEARELRSRKGSSGQVQASTPGSKRKVLLFPGYVTLRKYLASLGLHLQPENRSEV